MKLYFVTWRNQDIPTEQYATYEKKEHVIQQVASLGDQNTVKSILELDTDYTMVKKMHIKFLNGKLHLKEEMENVSR